MSLPVVEGYDLAERALELLEIRRLRQVLVEPRLRGPLEVFRRGIAAERDEGIAQSDGSDLTARATW